MGAFKVFKDLFANVNTENYDLFFGNVKGDDSHYFYAEIKVKRTSYVTKVRYNILYDIYSIKLPPRAYTFEVYAVIPKDLLLTIIKMWES